MEWVDDDAKLKQYRYHGHVVDHECPSARRLKSNGFFEASPNREKQPENGRKLTKIDGGRQIGATPFRHKSLFYSAIGRKGLNRSQKWEYFEVSFMVKD